MKKNEFTEGGYNIYINEIRSNLINNDYSEQTIYDFEEE